MKSPKRKVSRLFLIIGTALTLFIANPLDKASEAQINLEYKELHAEVLLNY